MEFLPPTKNRGRRNLGWYVEAKPQEGLGLVFLKTDGTVSSYKLENIKDFHFTTEELANMAIKRFNQPKIDQMSI